MSDPILFTPEDFRLAEAEQAIRDRLKVRQPEHTSEPPEIKCPRCGANVICIPLTCQRNQSQ